MNIDKIMRDAIIAEDNNREVPYGTYDRSWKKIQEKKSSKEKWHRKLSTSLSNFSFKEFAAVISFVLVLILIPTFASHYKKQSNIKVNVQQKHYKSFDAPDKIIIYNYGKSVTITATSPLFNKILELADKRFNNQNAFGTYLCYLHQQEMKNILNSSLSLKFIYSSVQESKFTILSVEGSYCKRTYNTIFMTLTDDLFYCYMNSNGSEGMGPLIISEDLIKLASDATSKEDNVINPISKAEAENLVYKTCESTFPGLNVKDEKPSCPIVYVRDEKRNGKDFYVFKVYQFDEINNIETIFAWYYINKNNGFIYKLDEKSNVLINISPN